MSQHDFEIANQTSLSARTDINNGLQALASNNSGASAPSTTYANMFWYDTTNNLLKMRDETDSTWIDVIYINQSTGVISILNDTNLVTSGGSTTGLLGDQLASAWNTGTGIIESLISPAKLTSAIETYYDANAFGVNQTWQDFTSSGRSNNTPYRNLTGRPIMVAIMANWNNSESQPLQVSSDGTTYIGLDGIIAGGDFTHVSAVIPDQHYYKIVGYFSRWAELR